MKHFASEVSDFQRTVNRLDSSSPLERTVEDLEIIYEELLHINALSHLSTMVKRELASVLVFESHSKAGTVCE